MRPVGLPEHIRACLFDLDGVLTETASIHFEAWRQTFDSYLDRRSGGSGHFEPFTKQDYLEFVDGKPRHDGVRSFLASRSIVLPEKPEPRQPDGPSVQELGDQKNALVLQLMQSLGVTPFEGSQRYLKEIQSRGLNAGVVSASANARAVLEAAGLLSRFEVIVDGVVAAGEGLRGKPFPDTFLYAARLLGTEPANACVFEDARAGVAAARAGGFGYVVGINRANQAAALAQEGADIVVEDLAELLLEA
ncbi:MAG: beta-phosphoglucomutase family hydrolase [Actinomycetota bacterium]